MRLLKFASLILCALCFIVRGDAQGPDIAEKPVWTLEFIEVTPSNMGLTLGYLDDHWMRVREEAKRRTQKALRLHTRASAEEYARRRSDQARRAL